MKKEVLLKLKPRTCCMYSFLCLYACRVWSTYVLFYNHIPLSQYLSDLYLQGFDI